ncbi:conserved Plasmodium protein, unknown function [Plasmodium malariae]|uniref:Uncharacterized protein n=1 Tax=Plasmodium malariae TaxID=5858 RepID=A0A1A8WGK7_PLAMA|nr:conserved Plasmodium protein, unknown function [Plasmodium malariae]
MECYKVVDSYNNEENRSLLNKLNINITVVNYLEMDNHQINNTRDEEDEDKNISFQCDVNKKGFRKIYENVVTQEDFGTCNLNTNHLKTCTNINTMGDHSDSVNTFVHVENDKRSNNCSNCDESIINNKIYKDDITENYSNDIRNQMNRSISGSNLNDNVNNEKVAECMDKMSKCGHVEEVSPLVSEQNGGNNNDNNISNSGSGSGKTAMETVEANENINIIQNILYESKELLPDDGGKNEHAIKCNKNMNNSENAQEMVADLVNPDTNIKNQISIPEEHTTAINDHLEEKNEEEEKIEKKNKNDKKGKKENILMLPSNAFLRNVVTKKSANMKNSIHNQNLTNVNSITLESSHTIGTMNNNRTSDFTNLSGNIYGRVGIINENTNNCITDVDKRAEPLSYDDTNDNNIAEEDLNFIYSLIGDELTKCEKYDKEIKRVKNEMICMYNNDPTRLLTLGHCLSKIKSNKKLIEVLFYILVNNKLINMNCHLQSNEIEMVPTYLSYDRVHNIHKKWRDNYQTTSLDLKKKRYRDSSSEKNFALLGDTPVKLSSRRKGCNENIVDVGTNKGSILKEEQMTELDNAISLSNEYDHINRNDDKHLSNTNLPLYYNGRNIYPNSNRKIGKKENGNDKKWHTVSLKGKSSSNNDNKNVDIMDNTYINRDNSSELVKNNLLRQEEENILLKGMANNIDDNKNRFAGGDKMNLFESKDNLDSYSKVTCVNNRNSENCEINNCTYEWLEKNLSEEQKEKQTAVYNEGNKKIQWSNNEEGNDLTKKEDRRKLYKCVSCDKICTYVYYILKPNNLKKISYGVLDKCIWCSNCYNSSKYPNILNSSNFVKVNIPFNFLDSDWSITETEKLIDAVCKYKNDWEKISEYVQSKTPYDCIYKFISMPLSNPYFDLDNLLNINDISFSTYKQNNTLLSLLSFICNHISPYIGAYAAKKIVDLILEKQKNAILRNESERRKKKETKEHLKEQEGYIKEREGYIKEQEGYIKEQEGYIKEQEGYIKEQDDQLKQETEDDVKLKSKEEVETSLDEQSNRIGDKESNEPNNTSGERGKKQNDTRTQNGEDKALYNIIANSRQYSKNEILPLHEHKDIGGHEQMKGSNAPISSGNDTEDYKCNEGNEGNEGNDGSDGSDGSDGEVGHNGDNIDAENEIRMYSPFGCSSGGNNKYEEEDSANNDHIGNSSDNNGNNNDGNNNNNDGNNNNNDGNDNNKESSNSWDKKEDENVNNDPDFVPLNFESVLNDNPPSTYILKEADMQEIHNTVIDASKKRAKELAELEKHNIKKLLRELVLLKTRKVKLKLKQYQYLQNYFEIQNQLMERKRARLNVNKETPTP